VTAKRCKALVAKALPPEPVDDECLDAAAERALVAVWSLVPRDATAADVERILSPVGNSPAYQAIRAALSVAPWPGKVEIDKAPSSGPVPVGEVEIGRRISITCEDDGV